MPRLSRNLRITALTALASAGLSTPAWAYIGPGAGFAAAGGVLVLLSTFALAFLIILMWPLKAVARVFLHRRKGKAKVKRMIVIGLDGLDPGLARRFMDEGYMPNFKKLGEQGTFCDLATAYPSISPVAWSSYATGVDASRHNIYDFLTRDPCSYFPTLSSSDISTVPKTLNLGLAKIPFGRKAVYRFMQKSQPFWKLLGKNGIWSSIIRVPITFPPQKFKNGTLLAGMCVPDLQGTQGSFSFYSTKPRSGDKHIGGQQYQVRMNSAGVIESKLTGPGGSDGHPMKCPFKATTDAEKRTVTFEVGSDSATVGVKEYTPWMTAPFEGVTGIVRFYVQAWDDEGIELYCPPININPDSPAMPISQPFVYAIYLAKMIGPYATLGLAEDTWALNERVVDEEAFLKQSWLIFEERKKMLWDVLEKTKKGFATVVFDTTDRISHMFYRYLDPTHPANKGRDTEIYKDTIRDTYKRMDDFLVEIQEKMKEDPDTVYMVISDHGFCNFTRCVNINSWLRDEGYLVLKDDSGVSGEWFQNIDWDKTRAFTLGLTGIFINREGREAKGIVKKGAEADALCAEIKRKLEALRDPESGETVITEAFITRELHSGPYADMAPEILVGYNRGFRHSWDCATGSVSKEVFTNNDKSWSGDHCVDPRLVPGVFWCNRKINTETPNILDMAPTALDLFGVDRPNYLQGQPLFGPRRADVQPAATTQGTEQRMSS